jgi:hypothetical protein
MYRLLARVEAAWNYGFFTANLSHLFDTYQPPDSSASEYLIPVRDLP